MERTKTLDIRDLKSIARYIAGPEYQAEITRLRDKLRAALRYKGWKKARKKEDRRFDRQGVRVVKVRSQGVRNLQKKEGSQSSEG